VKNPTWTRQETELLVNLYFDLKDKSASIFQANQEIEQLSTKLRSIAKTNGLEVGDTFRNYAGIKMKLANLLYIDTNGAEGLNAFSRLDKEVFDEIKKLRSGKK
jgi:hypothetical protein